MEIAPKLGELEAGSNYNLDSCIKLASEVEEIIEWKENRVKIEPAGKSWLPGKEMESKLSGNCAQVRRVGSGR